ncbi:zinc ABC transporter substrate-binding protein [Nakamurella sp. A5-74]|uniref:Zinc ABC transporter substrate-binding protein n=1 Tax=Nakamurella sp. A5-74 TaxID=3158264 RepID=A0AAU8DN19_9ACTN
MTVLPRRHSVRLLGITLTAGSLLLAGCGSSEPATTSPSAGSAGSAGATSPIPVVASTNVYSSVVSIIGGDRVDVTSIIADPSADPHSFEADPQTQVAIAKAKIVIANGGGYDDFVGTMVKATNTSPTQIDVVELSGLEKSAPVEDGKAFNEHVFYSTAAMRTLSAELVKDLSALDTAGASTFAANAREFDAGLAAIDQRTGAIKAAHPGSLKAVVTEPVADYLLAAAGFQDVTPKDFAEAIEEENDPSVKDLADIDKLVSGKQVQLVAYNEQTSGPVVEQVRSAAEKAGVPVLPVTETFPEGVTDYLAWINGTLDTLEKELG